MKINKQLFEDVLSGKLKGTFILRDQLIYNSVELTRNVGGDKSKFPYCIERRSYMPNGMYCFNGVTNVDIIDFIPYTDMKENELTIEIPEGQEIDWQESAKQEKIVFKKKDTKPRSWEDYLELNTGFDGVGIDWNCGGVQTTGLHHRGKAVVPTHLAQPFIAMMQLMSLRQEWIGDWKPDWSNEYTDKYCIIGKNYCNFEIYTLSRCRYALSFPTREMATDFMNTFKDLLKIAKPLI